MIIPMYVVHALGVPAMVWMCLMNNKSVSLNGKQNREIKNWILDILFYVLCKKLHHMTRFPLDIAKSEL